jgi:phenylacetate-CoA ligase
MDDPWRASQDEIAAMQEQAFARMMDLAAVRHPRTRALLASANLSRADFRSLADLRKLPLTTKDDYLADPDAMRLDCSGLAEEAQSIWDVMHTTGSSAGRSTPFVSTTYDFFRILEANRAMLRIRGVRADDVIANLFPLTLRPHGAFIRVLHAASALNVRVVSALPGNPSPEFTLGSGLDRVVEIVAQSRASIVWGVPSYLRRVLARAEERHADFSAVRLAFVTGEGLSEASRDQLTAQLRRLGRPDAWVSISYGATELQGGLVECTPGSGYHNPAPDQFHLQVVDPLTAQPVADGEPGLVVLTHLRRRGTVLLRYSLGDTSVMSHARCPHCGAGTDRLVAIPRRADRLLKIKGMLVNPDVLEQAAEAVLGAREYQFVVERSGGVDVLVLKVASRLENDLLEKSKAAVKRACGVTPLVDFVSAEALVDPKRWKAKRVVDQRRPM